MRFLSLALALSLCLCLGACVSPIVPMASTTPVHEPLRLHLVPPDISKVLAQLGGAPADDGPIVDICKGHAKCVVVAELLTEVDEGSVAVVVKRLQAAEAAGAKAFVLEIDSPGGSVPDGMVLAKAIERSPVPVTCVVDMGEAASMGSYILESCPVRVMTVRGSLMFHEIGIGAMMEGQPNQWKAFSDKVATMEETMAEHNIRRTTMSMAEYKSRTDGGRMMWLTHAEALRLGFVDKVVGTWAEVIKSVS
jgi:ATP-dependent protease ClpP protease subunit